MALARAYILQGNRMAARDYLQRSVKEPVNAFGRLWWNLHRSILFLHFNDLAAARFSLNRVRPGIVAAARGTRRVIRAALSQIGRTGRLLKTPMELVKEEPMVSRRRGVERELIAHLSLIAASIGSPSPY